MLIRRHIHLAQDWYEGGGLPRLRRHLLRYAAGLPGASYFRARVNETTTYEALFALIDEYEDWVCAHE